MFDFSRCTSEHEVMALTTAADTTNKLQLENLELLRCPPLLRTYKDIDQNDPEWREKTKALGIQIRKDIIVDFGPAFKSKSRKPSCFAAVEQVKITVNEGATKVNVHYTCKMPMGMHEECAKLTNRLEAQGKIRR